MSVEVHPLLRLREMLAREFTQGLPEGVEPVDEWCREPQFFPGASGMPTEVNWDDVAPGSRVLGPLPSAHGRDVMVVGNFQATVASYRRILQGDFGGFPVTWRALPILLSTIAPTRTFLTNAYPGLLDAASDTAKFPTTPSYLGRCQSLLTLEIELMHPTVVIALGAPAARLLAAATPQLHDWRPWPGFTALAATRAQTVAGCELAGVAFTGLAVHHPSAVRSRHEREADAELIAVAVSSR